MEHIIYFILVSIISFVLTAFSIPQIVRIAHAKHLFDTPDSRKLNKTVIPNLGGIAIFIGLMIGVTVGGNGYAFYDLKFIFASLIITFFTGLKDDLIGVSPRSKLLALSVSIFIIVFFANIRLDNLYGFLGLERIGYVPSFLLTFFVGIVIINSFNLIDGIDGLASMLAIETALVFGIWFAMVEKPEYALISFALAGSCSAFFLFNVFGKTNKLFMGDTGSLLIGLIIFVLAVKFNTINATISGPYAIESAPAVLIGILAYPLFDVLRVFFLRVVICRRSPFTPDKNHIHHRLLTLGFSHKLATFSIFIVNGIFIAIALLLQHLGVLYLTFLLLSISLVLSFSIELYILYTRKIDIEDEHQTLLLPVKFVQAKLLKHEAI